MNDLFIGSHYELIRNNSEYRMMCQLEDMILEQEPAWYREEEPVLSVIPPEHNLYNQMQQLKGRIIFLENKINSYPDKKRIKKQYKDYE